MSKVKHGANIFDISDIYGFNKDELMDFSSNINPFGSSEKGKNNIIKNIDLVSVYPDVEYKKLKNSISEYCNVSMNNIVLGAGATELISSFISTLNPENSLLISPAYSEYERELNKINSKLDKYMLKDDLNFNVNLSDLIKIIKDNNYKLVVICNPNNPTGQAFTKQEIEEILKSTNSFIMIDETYVEFTDTNIYSSTSLVDSYENLFVIRGTSKFFSTPGIRLGYGLTSNKFIQNKISEKVDLWNINIFASLMGEVMFQDIDYINTNIEFIKKERDYLKEELSKIDDLTVYGSKGNFILCKIWSKKLTAKELYEKLIEHKIIIRDASSFDNLDEYFFRICTLKHEENKFLIKKLREIFIP